MAKDVIVFGEVAARDVTMIEIRCGAASHSVSGRFTERPVPIAPPASLRDIMRDQIGRTARSFTPAANPPRILWFWRSPHCTDIRRWPSHSFYCPTLAQLFGVPERWEDAGG